MLYLTLFEFFILSRNLFYKYILGKIIAIQIKHNFYYINLPYLFCYVLDIIKYSYIYKYDDIIGYKEQYNNHVDILPPIIKFKINNKCFLNKLKNYKSNIPLDVFFYLENIKNINNITYCVMSNPLNIQDKNIDIKTLNPYIKLMDLFSFE